jgi:hypothetical protein
MMNSADKLKEKHRKAFQLWQKVKEAENSDNESIQKCFDRYLKELFLKYEMGVGWSCTVCVRHFIKDKLSRGSNGYYCKIYCLPYDLCDLLKHLDNKDHQRFMNIEYRELKSTLTPLTLTSSPSSQSPLSPNSSKNTSFFFSSRGQKPQIMDEAEEMKWFVLIQKIYLILHENLALKTLKPIMNSVNDTLQVLSSPNQPLALPIDHLSLQNEIGHLIAEEYRDERSEDVMGVKKGGYSIAPDNYKDVRMKEILDSMVRYLHKKDFSVGNNFLGAQRVEGERATGGQVFLATLRLLIRNKFNVFMLEHICEDGGSNFKGVNRGLVARMQKLLDGVAVLTWDWDPIHRFVILLDHFIFFHLLYMYLHSCVQSKVDASHQRHICH